MRLLRRGDVTGLEAIIGQAYRHTATVIDTALICRIPAAVVTDLTQQLPHFQHQLFMRWQLSVDETSAWLTELRTGRTRTRLVRLLLCLSEAEPTNEIFMPSLKDMGTMLAVTIETVSRTITQLKREELIERVATNRFRVDIDRLQIITRR